MTKGREAAPPPTGAAPGRGEWDPPQPTTTQTRRSARIAGRTAAADPPGDHLTTSSQPVRSRARAGRTGGTRSLQRGTGVDPGTGRTARTTLSQPTPAIPEVEAACRAERPPAAELTPSGDKRSPLQCLTLPIRRSARLAMTATADEATEVEAACRAARPPAAELTPSGDKRSPRQCLTLPAGRSARLATTATADEAPEVEAACRAERPPAAELTPSGDKRSPPQCLTLPIRRSARLATTTTATPPPEVPRGTRRQRTGHTKTREPPVEEQGNIDLATLIREAENRASTDFELPWERLLGARPRVRENVQRQPIAHNPPVEEQGTIDFDTLIREAENRASTDFELPWGGLLGDKF